MLIDHKPAAQYDFSHLAQEPGFESLPPPPANPLTESLDYIKVDNYFLKRPDGKTLSPLVRQETQPALIAGRLNEDCSSVVPLGPNCLLLCEFDGASSRNGIRGLDKHGLTGAFYVSHLAALSFSQSEVLARLVNQPDIIASDVLREMNPWLKSKLEKIDGVDYKDVLSIPGMASVICLIDANAGQASIANVKYPFS